ncbi:MAG: type 1 glutamine amidotransferase [Actinobacteria bacterium]|nr:type 1 glutamine amidotransferase [Actinomycetota bacterium]
MTQRLVDRNVAVFVEEGFEDLEFWVTVMRLREEGADVTILGGRPGEEVKGKNGLTAASDVSASDVSVDVFDGVVVPGGWAPDKLRRHEDVTGFVRRAHEEGKIIGLICHAGLVGISAGIVSGSKATGSLGIKDDLVNAGAEWVDEPAFRDGNIVWGRVVDDIPDFCRELVEALAQAP